MEIDINKVKIEYDEVIKKLGDPELISDAKKLENLSKRYNSLKKILEIAEGLEEIEKSISENEDILKSGAEPELFALAEEELGLARAKKKSLEEELKQIYENRNNEKQEESVIVEIRAGTGGEEAALFASDLFKMYSKYSQKMGWQLQILDSHLSDLGGFKEIIFEIKNHYVFSKLRWEAGVHRIQRIPKTEKSGRIHTSTATVAVLPKNEDKEIEIKPGELKFETFRSSGPGGQLVNRRESAVRVTHLPTGLIVSCQQARTQAQNRQYALSILKAKLLALKKTEELNKISKERKQQIGEAQRCEKIRTYNFPQDRITDHRIKKSWHNIQHILEGNLEPIIGALSNPSN